MNKEGKREERQTKVGLGLNRAGPNGVIECGCQDADDSRVHPSHRLLHAHSQAQRLSVGKRGHDEQEAGQEDGKQQSQTTYPAAHGGRHDAA